MYILGSGCGWIPDPPIKFMASIIDIIKVLTPVYLVIMGSIGFGKAIISQKEDEIKKAQGAFIKKIIAGAAVFFVIVFAEWVTNLITKVGGDASNAIKCVNALLNNTYIADDTDYYDPPETTTTTTTKTTEKIDKCNIDDGCICDTEVETTACFVEAESEFQDHQNGENLCVPNECECAYEYTKALCEAQIEEPKLEESKDSNTCQTHLNHIFSLYCVKFTDENGIERAQYRKNAPKDDMADYYDEHYLESSDDYEDEVYYLLSEWDDEYSSDYDGLKICTYMQSNIKNECDNLYPEE